MILSIHRVIIVKIFLPLSQSFFLKNIRILERRKCEIAPPGTQIDVCCKRLRFENGPCCAWSIQRDVGQDLRRWTDVPMRQLRCTSGQGAGPRFGWDKPIYLYSRCQGNCLCRVMGNSNILVRFHHPANIGASRLTSQ